MQALAAAMKGGRSGKSAVSALQAAVLGTIVAANNVPVCTADRADAAPTAADEDPALVVVVVAAAPKVADLAVVVEAAPSVVEDPEVRRKRNIAFHAAAGKYANGASNPNLSQMETLFSQGVDVDFVDGDGWSALFHACGEGHLTIATFLVEEAGANIDLRESDGCTCLWMACYNGRRDIAQYLLRVGADERVTGKPDGEPVQTPALAARRQSHPGLADLVDAETQMRRADPTRQPREKAREINADEFRETMRTTLTSMIKVEEEPK